MKRTVRWRVVGVAGLGLALAALSGCQTWVAGMPLPSGHYLQHPPQYFPPSPAFPLTRELASQDAAWSAAAPIGAPVPLPPPVLAPGVPPAPPGGPAPLPPPVPAGP